MASNNSEVNGSIWQWADNDSEGRRANWFTVLNNRFEKVGFGDPPNDVRSQEFWL